MPKTEAEKAAKAAAKQAAAEAAAKAERKAAKAAAKSAPAAEPAKSGKGGKSKSSGVFADPGSGGDLFSAKNYPDSLILFYPQRIDTNVTTAFGTEPEVPVGKVIVLNPDKPAKPVAVFPSTPVFGKALLNALRPSFDEGRPTAGLLHSAQFKNGDGWVIDKDARAEQVALAYIESASAELLA